MLTQLQSGTYRYSPQTGIGTTGAPFTGTLTNFAKQFISQQGEAATSAKQLSDGQAVVLNTLQKKVTDASGVNIDDEMAHLLALQNAYSANARVMAAVDIASGVQSNVGGVSTQNAGQTASTLASGVLGLNSSTGADLSITGKADTLNALKLTGSLGAGNTTVGAARTTTTGTSAT